MILFKYAYKENTFLQSPRCSNSKGIMETRRVNSTKLGKTRRGEQLDKRRLLAYSVGKERKEYSVWREWWQVRGTAGYIKVS